MKKSDKEESRKVSFMDEERHSVSFEEGSQLCLFSALDVKVGNSDDYSNTIDIYDALPKYVWGRTREIKLKDLKTASITRSSIIGGRKLTVKLKPALIDKNGETVLIYPGTREEIVEDALRKIAVSGGGVYVNNLAGVRFTLYQLRMELKSRGHSLDIPRIKEALLVCKGALIECSTEDGESFVNSNLFGLVGLTSRADLKDGDSMCFVQFNPLVNDSILKMTYRQFNYKTLMGIPGNAALSRYIYKRMCLYWTQASEKNPYTPSLISFLEQSPRGILGSSISVNAKAMRAALDLLIKNSVISRYEEDIAYGPRRAMLDIKFKIHPHHKFVSDTIMANKRKRAQLAAVSLKTKDSDSE